MNKLVKLTKLFFIFVFIFFLLDFSVFLFYRKSANINYNIVRYNSDYNSIFNNVEFRKPFGIKYNKNPILIFGEGIAYGIGLDENQNFGQKLSMLTKRPVYNFAYPGHYIQHAILLVNSGNIDDIIKQSEYVLLFVPSLYDNYRLMTFPCEISNYDLYEKYTYPILVGNTIDNLHLKKQIFPFIFNSGLFRLLKKNIIEIKPFDYSNYMNNLYNHIYRLRKDLLRINKDIKIIIVLVYISKNDLKTFDNNSNIYSFSIYDNIPDVNTNKLYINNENHPSEALWNKAVPIFAEYYNL